MAAGVSDVFVLDFDGVLVDSEPEVSTSAFTAARDYWPEVFEGVGEEQKAAILEVRVWVARYAGWHRLQHAKRPQNLLLHTEDQVIMLSGQ
jgi:beta-phosphoglucomutase-like phosphatase (HAD superfamily)